jgi:predicted nucleic acid-binding protein
MPLERIYVDSSAFYALMDRADKYHKPARAHWPELLKDDIALVTSNYVASETLTVLQYRIGFDAAKLWCRNVLGVLDVYWVDEAIHQKAHAVWMNLGFRRFSLVDCVSFVTMQQNCIEKAFCFKASYIEQGFELLPSYCVRSIPLNDKSAEV